MHNLDQLPDDVSREELEAIAPVFCLTFYMAILYGDGVC